MEEKEFSIEDHNEVRNIFLKPDVTDKYEISLGNIDHQRVIKLLVDDYDFSEARVQSALEKVRIKRKSEAQKKLDQWS
jgi:flap endonuclease-1